MLANLPVEIIVVSNQAGIALGIFSEREMSEFNSRLRLRVASAGGRIDAFYVCPHLEAKDLKAGESLCSCSKPAPGLLFEAAQDYLINLSESFVIGDRVSDILAGQAAGTKTILVYAEGIDEAQAAADFIAPDLLTAVTWIEKKIA